MFQALNNRNSVLEPGATRRTEPSPHQHTTPQKNSNRNTFQEVLASPIKALADGSIDIHSSILNCDKIEELKKDMEDVKIEHRKEVQGLQQQILAKDLEMETHRKLLLDK